MQASSWAVGSATHWVYTLEIQKAAVENRYSGIIFQLANLQITPEYHIDGFQIPALKHSKAVGAYKTIGQTMATR